MRTRTMVAAAGLLLVLLGVMISAYILFVHAPMKLADATAGGIKEMLNFTPRVTIDQTVVIEQNAPILEIATVSRTVLVDHSWSHRWLGSTKSLRVVGAFTAKAGFDLHEPFTIAIEKNPVRVRASMPPARILSLTMDSYRIEEDENGWWNRISSADRETAVRDLLETARVKALSSGILDDARKSIEERIREVVEKNGATVEFQPDPLESLHGG